VAGSSFKSWSHQPKSIKLLSVRRKHRTKSLLIGTGVALSSLALVALPSTAFSAWNSQVAETASFSTVSSIPAPVSFTITSTTDSGGIPYYDLSWKIPSGVDADGNPLAQNFEVQGYYPSNGTWTTIRTLSGTTTSYQTPATSSISKYRVLTVDNGWNSSYVDQGAPQTTGYHEVQTGTQQVITGYQQVQTGTQQVQTGTTTETVYNSPPNYCGSYYTCDPVSVFAAVSSQGFGLYPGSGQTPPGYNQTLTGAGQGDGWTYIASWSAYHEFANGQVPYAWTGSYMAEANGCQDGGNCPFPPGIEYFLPDFQALNQGSSIIGEAGTYQPECDSYNASNSSSYLDSCVYPYDGSYQPTSTESVPTYTTEPVYTEEPIYTTEPVYTEEPYTIN